MTAEKLEQLRESVLSTCLQPYNGTLASGAEANAILDMHRLERCQGLAARVVVAMAPEARTLRPDLVVPVPNGANWAGRELGLSLGTGSVLLDKDPETGVITANPSVEKAVSRYERLLLVEDVFTQGTNTRKVLAIPAIAERAVAVCAIWDRGDPDDRPPLGIPVYALFKEHIPPMLEEDSEYWQHIGQPA